ncbi:MAG TPA: hypothetical protein DDY77_06235 [Clostridiales bacterium]|nr:hypothetical protein [Clostridiales bacterium]
MKRKVSLFLSLLLAFVMVFAAVGCNGNKDEVKLRAIGVTTKPTKLEYVSGEKFDPTGMVVSAQYTDSKVKVVTGWDYDKKSALQEEDTVITIKYTEGTITKTCTLKITVNPGIDHVKYHEFVDGKCSCGAMQFEAEKGITGGTPANGNESFIVDSDKASGGKCIGNWGDGDNRWTTYFTVDKKVENVVIGMTFAPTGALNNGQYNWILPTNPVDADRNKKGDAHWPFEVRLNGTIVSWQTSEVPQFGGSDYFEWKTLLTNGLTFNEGENMIEIEPWDFYGANIDYIFVNIGTDVKGEYTTKEVVPEHKHTFTEKRCECGAVMGEAEDCEVTGTPASWGGDKGFYRDEAGASGGYKVGAWGGADNKIYVRITSDAEYEKAKIGFNVQTGGTVANPEGFKFYKYDEETKTNGDEINHGTFGINWKTWRNVVTDELTIAKGKSTYVLESVGNVEIDFDYFFIEGITAEANVTFEKYVAPEPDPDQHLTHTFTDGKCTCGAVKTEAEDCTIEGTPASWAGTEGFFRSSDGCSGGKKVGAWGTNGDCKIYIKLTADKAYENVNMIFRLSTGGITNTTGFDFYFLDTKDTKIAHTGVSGSMGWSDIKSSAFNLKEGENVLVLEAYQANEVDWDYFVIENVPADSVITFSKYVKVVDPDAHLTHEFVNGKCSCGAVKVEAEDCTVVGTPASWAGTEGFLRASDGCSGNKKVGAWGVNGDNRIYIKFTSDKAYENVTMTFRLSTGGVVTATAFDFYFNETRGTKIAHPDLSGGMGWTDIKSSAFNIKQGENFLVLEAYQACEIDWDYFVIEGLAADSVITVTKYVPAA